MGVLASDTIKVADCIKCKCAQASYGRYCSLCFFTTETQEKIRLVLEEETSSRVRRIKNIAAWVFSAIILAVAVYALSFFEK